ncbi:expressed unknown protein [Seminavis robusta]|uniref:Uncharacterized protein n=1 Tax=Seminavis robusta TaxID=568900 RepID=A0A9N8HWS2_9STRA|nr:expressed unknown protein [Seminavis robusta]|eukprot:Sro2253_g320920.1 n/a (301) ;mRNA; r:12574-13476
MIRHSHNGVVLQVDQSLFPKRTKRASAPPKMPMTIAIPSGRPHAMANHWHPPQEIIIEEPHSDEAVHKKHKKKKPPKTIQVKDDFRPPSVVVVVDKLEKKDNRIPPVIKVQQELLDKTDNPHGFPGLGTSDAIDESETTEEVPALADELTMIQKSSSERTTLAAQIVAAHNNQPRISSPDPPAAKAETTSHKILPDFSAMAKQRRQSESSSRRRRRNILDVSDGNHSYTEGPLAHMYMRNHESWPAPATHNNSRQLRRSSSTRTPHWIGVTGTADDWIRATKPDDILEVGRKIARHRLEI